MLVPASVTSNSAESVVSNPTCVAFYTVTAGLQVVEAVSALLIGDRAFDQAAVCRIQQHHGCIREWLTVGTVQDTGYGTIGPGECQTGQKKKKKNNRRVRMAGEWCYQTYVSQQVMPVNDRLR